MITKSSFKLIIAAAISITLTHHASAADYVIPSDTAPTILVAGDTLTLNAGGAISGGFYTHDGSITTITGGSVSGTFVNYGEMNISGGTFVAIPELYLDSNTNISGGTFDAGFLAGNNADVQITGGTILGIVGLDDNVSLDVSGGVFSGQVNINHASTANISGGTFNSYVIFDGAIVTHTISGGNFNAVGIINGATIDVHGSNFKIDGLDVAGSIDAAAITSGILTGTLADGNTIEWELDNDFNGVPGEDYFLTGTINLVPIPEPTTALLFSLTTLPLLSQRAKKIKISI
ncbi:hypothetical protein [Poriferisphaera sp. WC338]|uniref:hypothetical protein n=1 Tax=Poriferisphaera sp. WC338 TaxID=3425129 RepID=UPI003D814B05